MNIINNITIERALNDLRVGFSVAIKYNNDLYLISMVEQISEQYLNHIKKEFDINTIIINENRAKYIFKENKTHELNIENLQYNDILTMAGVVINQDLEYNINNLYNIKKEHFYSIIKKLMNLTQLVPSSIVSQMKSKESMIEYIKKNNITIIAEEDLLKYSNELKITRVLETDLNIKNAKNTKIVSYRSNIGHSEHYAILIDNYEIDPVIRIHSSCYTGDLLKSLTCDCRDQLDESIKFITEHGGGAIIYLMQEGRGIGLTNKLRAYSVQKTGLDTVEANEILGFDEDNRSFNITAQILNDLNMRSVKILTNNPQKIQNLKDVGINVLGNVSLDKHNEFNSEYMNVKLSKMGHFIRNNDESIQKEIEKQKNAFKNWNGVISDFPQHIRNNDVYLELFNIEEHIEELYNILCIQTNPKIWEFMKYGPFADFVEFKKWIIETSNNYYKTRYVIFTNNKKMVGTISFINTSTAEGNTQIGGVLFSDSVTGTKITISTIILCIKTIFSLGYLRCEWKCNSLNYKSIGFAKKLGFVKEGLLRDSSVVKNKIFSNNWFSMLKSEWQLLDPKFDLWLDKNNFDSNNKEIKKIQDFINHIN